MTALWSFVGECESSKVGLIGEVARGTVADRWSGIRLLNCCGDGVLWREDGVDGNSEKEGDLERGSGDVALRVGFSNPSSGLGRDSDYMKKLSRVAINYEL